MVLAFQRDSITALSTCTQCSISTTKMW